MQKRERQILVVGIGMGGLMRLWGTEDGIQAES